MRRCQQGWGLANRVTQDKAAVDSLGRFLSKMDRDRAPRRFRQAEAELAQKRFSLVEGKRWLTDHDEHCETCGSRVNGMD